MNYIGDAEELTGGCNRAEVGEQCTVCGGEMVEAGSGWECENCGTETLSVIIARDAFISRLFSNLPDCPFCDNNYTLKVSQKPMSSKHFIECDCGMQGPHGKTEREARENWEQIFG